MSPKEAVDALVEHFWYNGYICLSRKYGTYLPAPRPVDRFEVDAVGKYKQKTVLGIVQMEEKPDIEAIKTKVLHILHKYAQMQVTFYIGASPQSYTPIFTFVNALDKDIRKRIKVFILNEKISSNTSHHAAI